MKTFSNALEGMKKNELWKREIIKNDTVIIWYKKRLYQMSQSTGVRYPYTPTNSDIMANDWDQVILRSDRENVLVDQTYKIDRNVGISNSDLKLNKPSKYSLGECLEELKFGRTSSDQKLIDLFISQI